MVGFVGLYILYNVIMKMYLGLDTLKGNTWEVGGDVVLNGKHITSAGCWAPTNTILSEGPLQPGEISGV